MSGRFLPLVVALLLCGQARAADPAATKRARISYDLAMKHYNVGEFAEALKCFREAYFLVPDPRLLFNMAQAERGLGDLDAAAKTFRAYLRELPDAGNGAQVVSLLNEIDGKLKAKKDAEAEAARQKELEQARQAQVPKIETPPPTQPIVEKPLRPAPIPVYKRWWLWTAVGVAAAGVAVGLGVGLTQHSFEPTLSGFSRSLEARF